MGGLFGGISNELKAENPRILGVFSSISNPSREPVKSILYNILFIIYCAILAFASQSKFSTSMRKSRTQSAVLSSRSGAHLIAAFAAKSRTG